MEKLKSPETLDLTNLTMSELHECLFQKDTCRCEKVNMSRENVQLQNYELLRIIYELFYELLKSLLRYVIMIYNDMI